MSKKRIIVVEDEPDMAELVRMRLVREGYLVDVAGDGLSALKMIRANPPDLVLLDLMLPGLPGTEVATELRSDQRTAGVPVVMLTAKGEEADVVVGLKLGADDYITKPFSMSVLLARIAAVVRRSAGGAATGANVLQAGPVQIDQDRHLVKVRGKDITLTLTEFRILSALAAARGRILSRNQLIDQAMGMDAVVTDRTIDVHVTALRHKLGKARRIVKTVRGVGYRLEVEDEEVAPPAASHETS